MVTERCSRTRRKKIPEEYTIEEFVKKIKSQEIIGISKNSNLAKLMDEEKKARRREQGRINEILRSIRRLLGAEAGVETPSEETAKIYDKTKGIEVYTTLDGEAIACYTSKYRRPNQEDRAVVGSKIGRAHV